MDKLPMMLQKTFLLIFLKPNKNLSIAFHIKESTKMKNLHTTLE